ncbi:MAG: aminotransferase class IV [Acidobacteria bacterium]|nr:aminotransferase class IV [Acidobacteriota bacterium]
MPEPEDFVALNESIIPAADANLASLSNAALYGKGVFTTIAINAGKPVFWEKHWHRLTDNAARLGIGSPNRSSVLSALTRLIETSKLGRGRARVTVFDESRSPLWSTSHKVGSSVLITTAGPRELPRTLRLNLSRYCVNSRSPLAGIKSCNYLEQTLVLDEARKRGFDEAIRLNERGDIVSAAMANVFWVKNGAVFTPDLETGCLAGTTRGFVIENFGVDEVRAGLPALETADEVFVTSAGIGIRRAVFNDLENASDAITDKVIDAFRKIVAGSSF